MPINDIIGRPKEKYKIKNFGKLPNVNCSYFCRLNFSIYFNRKNFVQLILGEYQYFSFSFQR